MFQWGKAGATERERTAYDTALAGGGEQRAKDNTATGQHRWRDAKTAGVTQN